MKRGRRLLFVLAIAAGFGAVGAIGWAYFSAPGSGSANASVATLGAPTGVAASAVGSTVHVSWTGVAGPDGSSTVGYWVQRYSGSTPTDACGSSHASPVAVGTGAKSCDDTSVASGTYTYKVTSVFRSWTTASTPSSSVTVAPLDHFTVTAPGSATAGTAFSVTVAAKDASNNTITAYAGTIHFSTSDLNAPVLPGNYTFVGGDNGTHTFSSSVTLKTAGAQTVSVNDTVQTSKTGTSSSITVAGSTLDHFVVTAPSSASVATAFTTSTTSARDIYNNPASGWTSATKCVAFSGPASAPLGTAPSYPAQGGCSAGESSLSFNASGQASGFSITLYKAETHTLTVTDPVSAKTGTSGSIVVSPVTAVGFLVTSPSSATAGTQFTVTSLTARDAYNNVATGYAGTKTIVWSGPSNAPNGTAPTFPATSVAFTAGVSTTTLNATLVKAESATLTASQTAGPSGSASITVNPGSASKLAFTTQPVGNVAEATSFGTSPAVSVMDSFNNVVTSDVGTVTLAKSSGPSAGTLSCSNAGFPAVAAVAGVATFTNCQITGTAAAGTYTLAATRVGLTSTGASSNVVINPASAATLSLAAATTTPTAGVADNLTITAKDTFANVATGYTGDKNLTFSGAATIGVNTPTVSSKTGAATNFGTATTITFASGVSTVSGATNGAMILKKAETASIIVTDGTINNGAGLSVSVSAAGPASLALGAATTTPTAGAADNLTVTASALDAFGNTAVSYGGDKILTFGGAGTSPSGTVPTVSNKSGVATDFGTATTITFASGVATVSGANNGVMKLYKAETASITVTDGTISNGTGLSVTVSPAAASVIQLSNCNLNGGSVTCGSSFSLGNSPGNVKANVRVTDAFGNTPAVTTVSFTITSANGNYTIAGSTVTITAGTTSTTQFTVTHANNASNTAIITVHATSGSYTDFTFTVQK